MSDSSSCSDSDECRKVNRCGYNRNANRCRVVPVNTCDYENYNTSSSSSATCDNLMVTGGSTCDKLTIGEYVCPSLDERLKKLEEMMEELVVAQNESREKIQALLDYCFTDKSQWKEGASISSSAGNRCTLSISEEGQGQGQGQCKTEKEEVPDEVGHSV